MKKRWIKLFVLIACVLCLAGCSTAPQADPNAVELTPEQEQQWYDSASQFVLAMNEAVEDGTAAAQADDPIYGPAFTSWENAQSDIGEVQDIVGKSCSFTKKDGVVTVTVKGSRHDADVVFTMEQADDGYEVTNITTNVEYSMQEKIQQAGLNTLLGMGTTFFILILLAVVIAIFGKAVGGFMEKTRQQTVTVSEPESAAAPAAPALEAEEELADDLVLAAVIAAAVAAYEGTSSTDGFVVRSIRKSRKR